MKETTKLRKYFPFQLNECEAVREYLEEMAQKGWKLVRFGKFFHFKKIEPQRLYYAVELLSGAPSSYEKPGIETPEYFTRCHEAGWDYLCHCGPVHVFISEHTGQLPAGDEDAKRNIIRAAMYEQCIIGGGLPSAIYMATFYLVLYGNSFFKSSVIQWSVLLLCISFLSSFSQCIRFLIWYFRQKRRRAQGEATKYIHSLPRHLTAVNLAGRNARPYGIWVRKILLLFGAGVKDARRRIKRRSGALLACVFVVLLVSAALFRPSAHFPESESATFRYTSTDTALCSTRKFFPQDGTPGFTVLRSKYKSILVLYQYAQKQCNTKTTPAEHNQPEWGAKAVFCSGMDHCIVYDDCVITFFTLMPLSAEEIQTIRKLAGV